MARLLLIATVKNRFLFDNESTDRSSCLNRKWGGIAEPLQLQALAYTIAADCLRAKRTETEIRFCNSRTDMVLHRVRLVAETAFFM
ncbi:hypothetical protein SBDP1_200062 [Syntrophobacter sp. SbD1]|nr:hypothetical protein SBDP1_200062 [Syntrophobacter sp. SbD1]